MPFVSIVCALTLGLSAVAFEGYQTPVNEVVAGQFVVRAEGLITTSLEKYIKDYSIRRLFENKKARELSHYFLIKIPKLSRRNPKNVLETKKLIEKINQERKLKALPDYFLRLQSNDPYFPPSSGSWGQDFYDLWGLDKLEVEKAWERTRGENQMVAVIDSGADYTHPDLKGQIIKGKNFIDGTLDPKDDQGHGTLVSGTIVAIAGNEIGIAGVAPKAKVLAIKVIDSFGYATFTDLAQGIEYAADEGATVANMSLGANIDSVPEYYLSALKYAHDHNVVLVAAAGNDGDDLLSTTPANSPYVIAVSAFNSKDERASFSNYGPKIAVAAPGGGDTGENVDEPMRSILSLLSQFAPISGGKLVVGKNYMRQAGTSMASPHAAGVAALIRAVHPEYTVEQVRQALSLSTDDLGSPGFDNESGHGRINAWNAVEEITTPLEVLITSPNTALPTEGFAIEGIVAGDSLTEWWLEYGEENSPTEWILINQGSRARRGKLGDWDASELTCHSVTLRLTAIDSDGREYEFRNEFYVR